MSTPFKLSIPKPCDANWDHMTSEQKSRHCQQCSQSVYSLEEFDESEVVDLLQQKVCVRIQTNTTGQIKTRNGFSSLLLLGGLLACGETSEEPGLTSETEQSVEVLQVTPGQSVTLEVQENTPKAPPPPVMGKIAAPVHPKATAIEMGEVEMLQTDHGQPSPPVDKKSTEKSTEDCQTDAQSQDQLSN